jgi:hypothetical protein
MRNKWKFILPFSLVQLEKLRSENADTVAKLWGNLTSLWNRVEMPDEDREKFQSQHSGISQRTIQSVSSKQSFFIKDLGKN